MEQASPPVVIVIAAESCSDGVAAREQLARAVGSYVAPVNLFRLTVTFKRDGAWLRGDGSLTNELGVEIGTRRFSSAATNCSPLGRAISVWASLVLDAESERLAESALHGVRSSAASSSPSAPRRNDDPAGGEPAHRLVA